MLNGPHRLPSFLCPRPPSPQVLIDRFLSAMGQGGSPAARDEEGTSGLVGQSPNGPAGRRPSLRHASSMRLKYVPLANLIPHLYFGFCLAPFSPCSFPVSSSGRCIGRSWRPSVRRRVSSAVGAAPPPASDKTRPPPPCPPPSCRSSPRSSASRRKRPKRPAAGAGRSRASRRQACWIPEGCRMWASCAATSAAPLWTRMTC